MQQEINKDSIVLLPTNTPRIRVNTLLVVDQEIIKQFPNGKYTPKDINITFGIEDSNDGMTALTKCLNGKSYWNGYINPVFLYIVDKDAPIKERDYAYLPKWNIVVKMNSGKHYSTDPENHPIARVPKEITGGQYDLIEKLNYNISSGKGVFKIIATNDPKLIADGVAGISDEFIRQWVEAQGKEYKVMMEMEYLDMLSPIDNAPKSYYHSPKISNNQLILSIVEEKQEYPDGWSKLLVEEAGYPKELYIDKAHSVEDSDIPEAVEGIPFKYRLSPSKWLEKQLKNKK